MTQIKTSFRDALLILSRPAQLQPNIFQKEKGPCSLKMYKMISNQHQSSQEPDSELADPPERTKKHQKAWK